jgi:hypothetical protein
MEAPPNRRFYGKMECLPIWPTYTAEKGRTLGKTYGIKERCYWEHPLGNTLGTHWELDRNMLGTNKKEKKSPLQRIIMSQSDYQFCNLVYLCCHSIPLKFNNYVQYTNIIIND